MYLNWQEKVALADPLHWYSTTTLIQYLHALSDYILNVTDNYYITANIPQLVRIQLPASRIERFAEEGRYICESFGGINKELSKLALTINVLVNAKKITRQYPRFKTPGEAEVYALERINFIISVIPGEETDANNIFQRQNFEERHNLVWEENPGS